VPFSRNEPRADQDLIDMQAVEILGRLHDALAAGDFNRDMRHALLAGARFDGSQLSPAVFGSLLQAVMQPRERRQIGAHYTSERDILRVIRSLFLDGLRAEFQRVRKKQPALCAFHEKLGRLRFLDPACGCGDFLVVTYRELRRLEIDVLKAIHANGQRVPDITHLSVLGVDAMYGIEVEERPARIAEAALWLVDHEMNLELSEAFGQCCVRLPLTRSPTIVHGNALRLDWQEVLPAEQCHYVLGNPPFVGAKYQTAAQRADMAAVAGDVHGHGLLDYVAGWYLRAADYIQGTRVKVGFVSTSSITQGEQVGVLWNALYTRFGVKILFAHRTFAWESESRGKAHVHVVIIGFSTCDTNPKRIYEHDPDSGAVTETSVGNISPYLVAGPDRAITNRRQPLSAVPRIGIGNKPIDDGNYLFTPQEKEEFLRLEPAAAEFFRQWVGSDEFLNGIERWCLWLGDCSPHQLRRMPLALARVQAVRRFRASSRSAPTRKLAETPTRFHVENMPERRYLLIPKVSSERRQYIPLGFMEPHVLASDLCFILDDATLYHFGVLSSAIHMAWVRQVCGRLESRYRYSANLVYNNFPWPIQPSEKRRGEVEAAAQLVLDARSEFAEATLADLYDPLTTPRKLLRAHAKLDRAVDACYRSPRFASDRQRVEFLFTMFELREKGTGPFCAKHPPGRSGKRVLSPFRKT